MACNRPFGNERASEPMRNYPFIPESQDVELIRSQLWNGVGLMKDVKTHIDEAWQVRQGHSSRIWFSVPGVKHYQNRYYTNHPLSFVNLSVTGSACACRCAHCGGKLLQNMIPAVRPEDMFWIVDHLAARGCRGILVSGGADKGGEVPLLPFVDAIKHAKNCGLRVLVHSGIIRPETAAGLKEAGVDQVLMDNIGDETTIHSVYHLQRKPEEYLAAMFTCIEHGLKIAPHVVIGLHYGDIVGEMRALEMIQAAGPEILVLVVLTPIDGTDMDGITPPSLEEVVEVMAAARLQNPGIPVSLGCARPVGRYKREVEKMAVDCGFNVVAYPDETTVDYARCRGLMPVFTEECCSLAGRQEILNS